MTVTYMLKVSPTFSLLPSDVVVTPGFFLVVKNRGPIIFIFNVFAVPSSYEMLGADTTIFTRNPVISVYSANPSFSFLVVFWESEKTYSFASCVFSLAIRTLVYNALNDHVARLFVNKLWNADVSVPSGSICAHVQKAVPQLT